MATYSPVGTHAVVRDNDIQRLWAVGDTKLTAQHPQLQRMLAIAKIIPGNGHDSSRYEGDRNLLYSVIKPIFLDKMLKNNNL